jgi:hypothetical protein
LVSRLYIGFTQSAHQGGAAHPQRFGNFVYQRNPAKEKVSGKTVGLV